MSDIEKGQEKKQEQEEEGCMADHKDIQIVIKDNPKKELEEHDSSQEKSNENN